VAWALVLGTAGRNDTPWPFITALAMRSPEGIALEIGGPYMRECMLAWRKNGQSPDDGGRSTHGGPKRKPLDLPPRWFGLHSVGTP